MTDDCDWTLLTGVGRTKSVCRHVTVSSKLSVGEREKPPKCFYWGGILYTAGSASASTRCRLSVRPCHFAIAMVRGQQSLTAVHRTAFRGRSSADGESALRSDPRPYTASTAFRPRPARREQQGVDGRVSAGAGARQGAGVARAGGCRESSENSPSIVKFHTECTLCVQKQKGVIIIIVPAGTAVRRGRAVGAGRRRTYQAARCTR